LAGSDAVLSIPAPDETWEEVPFADATLPEKEIPAAKSRAVKAMFSWGVLVESSRASRLGRYTLNKLMKADPEFRSRMSGAKRNCMERVEREMIRRGMLSRGELAAIYITKHNIPKYQEIQRVELTGKNGAPVAYVDAKAELLRRLEAIALKASESQRQVVGGKPQLVKGSEGLIEVGVRKSKREGFGVRSRK